VECCTVARGKRNLHQDLEMAFLDEMVIANLQHPYEGFRLRSLTDHCVSELEVPTLAVVHSWLGEMSYLIVGVGEQHSYTVERSTQVMNEGLVEAHFGDDQELSFHNPNQIQHGAEEE
jgi:hypothetical protein